MLIAPTEFKCDLILVEGTREGKLFLRRLQNEVDIWWSHRSFNVIHTAKVSLLAAVVSFELRKLA